MFSCHPAQNNPSNVTAKILSVFNFPMKNKIKNQWPLNRSLGLAFIKKYCHVGILETNNLWTLASSVKSRDFAL